MARDRGAEAVVMFKVCTVSEKLSCDAEIKSITHALCTTVSIIDIRKLV